MVRKEVKIIEMMIEEEIIIRVWRMIIDQQIVVEQYL